MKNLAMIFKKDKMSNPIKYKLKAGLISNHNAMPQFNFILDIFQVKEAQRFYKTATKLDETSIIALSGIIACQILDGQYEVAKEQLEFLKGMYFCIVKYVSEYSFIIKSLNQSKFSHTLGYEYFSLCQIFDFSS